MKFNPYNYQRFAINHVLDHKAAGLFLDMGMGKTVSTLTALLYLLILNEVNKALVVAPKRVAEDTWGTEIDKWDHLKGIKVSKIIGARQQREKAVEVDADLYVISRDNVQWLVDNYFNTWYWDMLIIDELSSFKSSKSKRFRALKKVRPHFKRVVGLTGTPAPNGLIDLWPQIYLLDGGKRLGKTKGSYLNRYFIPGRSNGYVVYDYIPRKGSDEAIQNKIGDICISMKSEDYLDLPECINNMIKVNLSKKEKSMYKELEKSLVLEIGDKDITAVNAAVLTNKLLQMANGAIYTENKEVLEVHDKKLEALLELIEAANGKPVLVFYSFKHDLNRILKALKKLNIEGTILKDSKEIKAWNEGKIKVLLTHPASAGHGLNLQYGGNIIVWFGLTWSLELYQQANKRLHRQGQKETVIIHHIIAKDTVDEDVIKVLSSKESNQDDLLEAVKARLKGED